MQQTLYAVKDSSHCAVETRWTERHREGVILVKTQLGIQPQSIAKIRYQYYGIAEPVHLMFNPVISAQGTEGSFGIDNEDYEAMPVEVKLLPRKLRFFCDPTIREQILQSAVQ